MKQIYNNDKDGRPWVYIAGPYSQGDPVQNTRRAILVANMIVDYGVVPIVPHLTMTWDLSFPRPPLFWYEYTLDLLRRCDAIYRIKGESVGADKEWAWAEKNNLTLLRTPEELVNWAQAKGVR